MKRDIKKENEIINNVVVRVVEMFKDEFTNNIGHRYSDFLSLFDRIKKHVYSFYKNDEILDGIMIEFNDYLDKFENSDEGDRECRVAINHFIKEVQQRLPY